MATQYDAFEPVHTKFIEDQHIFFVGTAGPEGRVNVSPKGMDALRVAGPNRVLWLNLTGSGNETAGHLLENNRMTLMWCSFERRPLILRAYGTARAVHDGDAEWADLSGQFPPQTGARQVYDMQVEMVQTSCGYAVPFMDFVEDRDTLSKWADNKERDGVRAYWGEKNTRTLDGKPTGVPEIG